MRYCSHCGNALSVGASFCHSCGAPLKAFVPDADETPVVTPAAEEIVTEPIVEIDIDEPVVEIDVEEPVVEIDIQGPAEQIAPVVIDNGDEQIREEREFLDATHRFLRWERKAWSITGKVFLIVGIVLAALFLIIGIGIGAAAEEPAVAVLFLEFALIYGIMFIGVGIVNLKAAGKIPQYTDTLYRDFSAAYKRCSSIGMIVFTYFFNPIALVFYVINFARMKSNKKMAERILTRQGVN